MAISTATILSGVTLTAAAEMQTNPTQSDQSAKTWKRFTLQALFTNPSTASAQNRMLRLWYAVTNETLTAGAAGTLAEQLRAVARPLEITLPKAALRVAVYVSPPIDFAGGYITVWTDHEAWDKSVVLTTLKAVEVL